MSDVVVTINFIVKHLIDEDDEAVEDVGLAALISDYIADEGIESFVAGCESCEVLEAEFM